MSTLPAVPNLEQAGSSTHYRCTHLRTDGKRCARETYPGHTSLCHYHLSRELRGISDGDLLAADILNSIGNFQSATAINLVLGKIFVHQITGRLSRQDALALCYNCQLLLQSLPAVKQELIDGGYGPAWKQETDRIHATRPDLCRHTNKSLLPAGLGPLKPDWPAPLDPPPPKRESPSPSQQPPPAQNRSPGMEPVP